MSVMVLIDTVGRGRPRQDTQIVENVLINMGRIFTAASASAH
jgi:hypothetical protein